MNKITTARGYTLIELMVSIGLFSVAILLTAGAYLTMINTNRHVQAIATGINNLSFALETMTRTIRTGTHYSCNVDVATGVGSDCSGGGTSLYVTNATGVRVRYDASNNAIRQNGIALTDPSVIITSLTFNASGTGSFSATGNNDIQQPYVTITIMGNVSSGPGKTQSFTIETSAAMRGSDI